MALGQQRSRNKPVITGAMQALDQFKYEVASELGINPEYQSGYWGTSPLGSVAPWVATWSGG